MDGEQWCLVIRIGIESVNYVKTKITYLQINSSKEGVGLRNTSAHRTLLFSYSDFPIIYNVHFYNFITSHNLYISQYLKDVDHNLMLRTQSSLFLADVVKKPNNKFQPKSKQK